jgi:hypothetical protein
MNTMSLDEKYFFSLIQSMTDNQFKAFQSNFQGEDFWNKSALALINEIRMKHNLYNPEQI